VNDICQNSDMVVMWGGDPETTTWGFRGQFASRLLYFWTEIGLKQVYINPTSTTPPPSTPTSGSRCSRTPTPPCSWPIMHIWMTEGTYDKEYVATHTVGFDKMQAYVMVEEDGVVKDAAWASPKCGVPTWTIKALARDWAKKIVTIGHYFGGGMAGARSPPSRPASSACCWACRVWANRACIRRRSATPACRRTSLPAAPTTWARSPTSWTSLTASACSSRIAAPPTAWGKQMIPKVLIEEAIRDGKCEFWGTGGHEEPTSNQFRRYEYPIAKEDGGTEIHMMWTDTPCRVTCWGGGGEVMEAFRNPKIECVVAQHPWLENDTLCADIIFPVTTTLECDDISPCIREGDSFQSVILMNRAIDPVGEARTDYHVVCAIAEKMGVLDKVTTASAMKNSSAAPTRA